MMIDFSDCPNGYRDYSGSDNKVSIEYKSEKYMLKLPEERKEKKSDLQTSHVNNVLSEYIGSHIMGLAGLPVHETILGYYHGKIAVACKDFTGEGYRLQEFSWMMRSICDKSEIKRIPNYKQIYDVINNQPLLENIRQQAIDRYWDTFVMDALIGDFDRHKGNWGYLVNENTKDVKLAPIYDCGSCLYPTLSEAAMPLVLEDKEKIDERMYKYPNAALNRYSSVNGEKKIRYLDMMYLGLDENCTNALKRIYPRINMDSIFKMIEDISILSDHRIEFYEKMLGYRKELILDKAMEAIHDRAYREKMESLVEKTNGLVRVETTYLGDANDKSDVIVCPNVKNNIEIHINIMTNDIYVVKDGKQLPLFDLVMKNPEIQDIVNSIESALNEDIERESVAQRSCEWNRE